METFILANQNLALEFDRSNGAFVSITALESSWEILSRPKSGLSFRLLLPLSEKRNNQVLGEQQPLTALEIAPDQHSAILTWQGVTSEYGGWHAINITLEIKLSNRQAVFTLQLENHSDYIIENVYCPYLGDVRPPLGASEFKTFSFHYATAQEWSLWRTFTNNRGYYGVDYPTQLGGSMSCGTPTAPFILLRSNQQGLYVGAGADSSELVAWHAELRPGYANSINAQVPEELNTNGQEVTTRFAAVHLPYILPGESRQLTPIVLEAFQGDWQTGVDIYKEWRNTWLTLPPRPAWLEQPHSWQQLHLNSPEDELRLKFRDLVEVGKECARYGVKAIQLVGWNDGGQDRNNPAHDPDPCLGTINELREAIAAIQRLGVKVILFAKFTWADRSTERFRKDLTRLAVTDPYGDYYMHPGYQYQTVTQLLDINTRRLVPMCFLSEEYLQLCEAEFENVLALGADGILFDECMHHSPALLCFNTTHGHRYGAPVYANDRELIRRFAKQAHLKNTEFLFAGEACYDWEFEIYRLSYLRSENIHHVPLSRYLLPDVPLMTAVTGFNDRNMINQCLLYRYIISYEPYNFKGRLPDFPLTLKYGQQMDALREELRDYFWDGEFCYQNGALVTDIDGKIHQPFAVFRNRHTGKYALAIANYSDKDDITVQVKLIDTTLQALGRYRLVDDSTWRSATAGINIPSCSAVVVIE